MTKEQAIGNLKYAIIWNDMPKKEAMEMSIKALEQQTCEDAVSRQAVLDVLDKNKYSNEFCEEHHIDWSINLGMAHIVVNGLKPVTPQYTDDEIQKMQDLEQAEIQKAYELGKAENPKIGHWIMPVQDDGMSDSIYYQVRCSKCGFDLDPQTWDMELRRYGADRYCPKCGAKMYEVDK